MKQHFSAGGVVWQKNSNGKIEVLLLHRFKDAHWQFDSWHLPKGTMEKGETKKETAKREIEEETGYQVKAGGYLGSLKSTWGHQGQVIYKTTYYFACRPIKRISPPNPEHNEVKWVEINEAIEKVSLFPIFEKEEIILKKLKRALSS